MGSIYYKGETLYVNGHQGDAVLHVGDFVIMELDGHGAYPCDPVTFERKYEKVE